MNAILPRLTCKVSFSELVKYKRVGAYYSLPALIYTLSNNLTFYNLTLFDAGTFRVLYNLRVLTSGLLFQWFFKRPLSSLKWFALLLLVVVSSSLCPPQFSGLHDQPVARLECRSSLASILHFPPLLFEQPWGRIDRIFIEERPRDEHSRAKSLFISVQYGIQFGDNDCVRLKPFQPYTIFRVWPRPTLRLTGTLEDTTLLPLS